MDNIALKCMNGNNCYLVCSSKNCQSIPFMCNDDDCMCQQKHHNCTSNIKWKKIKQRFENKLNKPSDIILQYFQEIEQIYKLTIKEIQRSYNEIKKINMAAGLSSIEKDVLLKLNQNKQSELSGSIINQLQNSFETKSIIKIQSIQKQRLQITRVTAKLIKLIQDLTKIDSKQTENTFTHYSKFGNDVQKISKFFERKIVKLELIYRASAYNFQISKFWEKCNQKSNTITLIQTEFGKLIGGYTPQAWNKNLNNWKLDGKRQSFIFSITEQAKLQLIKDREMYAVFHHIKNGPTFGGHDLYICNKANENSGSYIELNNSYHNAQYNSNDQQKHKKFSGQINGRRFLINEWQVHQVIFQ